MSQERTGEVAAASPPSSQPLAANNEEQQINPSTINDASQRPTKAASIQLDQSSPRTEPISVPDDQSNDDGPTPTLPASGSERDVEAMTGLQDRSDQQHAESGTAAASSAPHAAGAPAKKFTSLNVNKRFLEKAAPTTTTSASPTSLKLGTSVSPRPSHRVSSPSTTSRLTSAKLSSVPKPQPAGWATTKPAPSNPKTNPSQSPPAAGAVAAASVPTTASEATSTTAVSSSDPLPAEASAALSKAVPSPKPANMPASQPLNSSAGASAAGTGAVASPRLISMGRDSPRPGSAGLESGSAQGRASPGLKNAALGASLRAPSPASVSRAPWAGVKSSLSPNPTPTARGRTLSDFPTAAEAAKAKQEQEEKAAAAAAREAARQQAALQALDRFRGTSLGSGKHWDEMEDEDGGFLGEVVEFGDGTQYKVPANSDGTRTNADDGPPVSKEDRFKDVSHDRSWPQRNAARPAAVAPNDRLRQAGAQAAAWGPMKNRELAVSAPTESAPPSTRPSRQEQRAEKVIIPTTGASVSLRSPIESRDTFAYSYGRERRPGAGAASHNGRQDQGAPPPAALAASTQAARAWGPLAQRQASLNPGAAPPSNVSANHNPSVESHAPPTAAPAPLAPEPARHAASLPPVQSQQQSQLQQQQQYQRIEQPRTTQPSRERVSNMTEEPAVPARGPANTNGRPLPPHLLVASSGDSHPPAQSSRPLPPHLAQNLRPTAAAQSSDTVGRKTSHAFEEARRPDVPDAPVATPGATAIRYQSSHELGGPQPQSALPAPRVQGDGPPRAPWGPKAAANTRLPAQGVPSLHQSSTPAALEVSQLPSAEPDENVHAAIERARKRREEEERARLAEKERARQKALAIEERIRAAQQQREAEAQRVAQKQAAEANAAAAAAAAAAREPEAPLRKAGPADSAASWRIARPQDAGPGPASARPGRQGAPAMPSDRSAALGDEASAERTRPSKVVSSQRAPQGDDGQPVARRGQRLAQPRDEATQRNANNHDSANRPPSSRVEAGARPEVLKPRSEGAEAPRIILARPVKSPPAPSPVESRPRETASVQSADPRSQKNASLPIDRASLKVGSSPKPRDPATLEKPSRPSTNSAPRAPVPIPSLAPAPAPVQLYPVVPRESFETRQEAVQDAPPAWNRFVVHIKGSRMRPRLNRYQQKQLAAKVAAMKAPGRSVYPLTWDPPLAHLSFKTLSRDDQLFPKRYHRGTVIAPVKLPSRTLPRGLPSIVPQVLSQAAGVGYRKQARFDLTPQWSEGHTNGLENRAAADGQASSLSPGAQIQVRLPGHHATVVQPAVGGSVSDGMQAAVTAANRRSLQVDPATDAIIGEVILSSASQSTFEDRSRAFHAGAAPGSLGPLDYPQNGYSNDAFGSHNPSGGYRPKGRRSSNPGVAIYDDRQVNTPSPVSFMVNSEIKADAGGARGSLSPFGIPASTRASQAQTPASGGSMLPSPSLSTQGTWGQSSLTFPVLETRSSNLADRDHIKSVWSLTTNSHSGELQNSLRDIGDDFMPSTLPMSVHDFRADEGGQLGGSTQEVGDRWTASTFNRFQSYGRSQHDMNSNSHDLSPVASRTNGFDPTSRSPSLGMDASAAAARARDGAQHHSSMSQQNSSAYSSLNGGAYAHHQTSSYSPRERQQDAGTNLSQGAFSAYGGYASGASNNVSNMTTDALYGMSNYGGGSMTPNRQTYGQYVTQASTARSAPGSPYSGMSRHTNNLTSGISGYSLFPNSGSGAARSSQASNGLEGLGVLDDSVGASFGSGRNQFYGARGYQQPTSSGSSNWPTSTSAASNSSSNVTGSVLRPAASVFNPSKYTASQQQAQRASQSQTQQSAAQAQQQANRLGRHNAHVSPEHHHHHHSHHAHHHEQHDELDPTTGGNSSGPIDRETSQYAASQQQHVNAYGSGAYSGFPSGSGLW